MTNCKGENRKNPQKTSAVFIILGRGHFDSGQGLRGDKECWVKNHLTKTQAKLELEQRGR